MRTLRRALKAALFDRKIHSELFFDSDATADAVLLVAAVAAIDYIGRVAQISLRAFSVTGLLETAIYSLVAWLILAGGTWLAATKLLQGAGQLQTMMRLQGHCELPLLLGAVGPLGATVGLVWSVAAKVPATSEASSLNVARSVAAVLIGLALVVLVRLIFRLPFMALSGIF